MKTNIKRLAAFVLLALLCASACVAAAGQLEQIQAYINYGITIRFDGIEQKMYDADGNPVYPISYNGTTYVPVRAVSNMFNVDVDWDSETKTVLLGKNTVKSDFINDLKPYSIGTLAEYVPSSEGKSIEIAGNVYDHWLRTNIYSNDFYYNLDGKYKTLTFKAFNKYFDNPLVIYGDDGAELARFNMVAEDLPKTFTVDVTDVKQLTINGESMWIFDAVIE